MDMDYQEGYVDGLAGIGMQERLRDQCPDDEWAEYENGFVMASLDRKAMLAKGNGEA